MKSLVGYTGFVGSNLHKNFSFDRVYNSKNIKDAFGTKPDLLVYSGVPAQKFIANKNPHEDFEIIENAIKNIKSIYPQFIVLISTIDVFKNPVDVDENSNIDTENLHPYGLNRYYLEKFIEESMDNYLIIRLPGLYGENMKKNFIFDLIHVIPSILNERKFKELSEKSELISKYYQSQNNGFYKCKMLNFEETVELKNLFVSIGFRAINFTDSRSEFQFYNLKYLWNHIQILLSNKIKKINLATEPVSVSELYKCIKGSVFTNELNQPVYYNFKTQYYDLFGGENGYIFDKKFVLNDIKNFVEEQIAKIKY